MLIGVSKKDIMTGSREPSCFLQLFAFEYREILDLYRMIRNERPYERRIVLSV